ncbi:ribose-5-phosphate isomerase A [Microlunatus endophyticus]|uniref:Ribose-5-phosphate isomerase A n=1 Tax=Microlunatus endophyticus TaxID=1716077 RepID=A0A917W8C2_9ACTN|nr:ribose-5-phosphate isomerase RpiA [Microlunatus endophyticus]GGL82094.1 ribose-5-phosphate isomerase A [Microlunatus endophyticus]
MTDSGSLPSRLTAGLSGQDLAKASAGIRAATDLCQNGMKLGLGSGSTAHAFVRALAERVRDGLDIVGVPTSTQTYDLAGELGVPLADLNDLVELDLTIDGTDQMAPDGSMIKGGGACLLWEKVVAKASRRVMIVADDTKLADHLGTFPLPIEVLPFGWRSSRKQIVELLADHGYENPDPVLRNRSDDLVITDSGNYILDVTLGTVTNQAELTVLLNQIPGVVENGFFVGIADGVVVGRPDGSSEIIQDLAGRDADRW